MDSQASWLKDSDDDDDVLSGNAPVAPKPPSGPTPPRMSPRRDVGIRPTATPMTASWLDEDDDDEERDREEGLGDTIGPGVLAATERSLVVDMTGTLGTLGSVSPTSTLGVGTMPEHLRRRMQAEKQSRDERRQRRLESAAGKRPAPKVVRKPQKVTAEKRRDSLASSDDELPTQEAGQVIGTHAGVDADDDLLKPVVDLSVVDPLSPADADRFAEQIAVLGLPALEKVRSPKHQHRVEAVQEVTAALSVFLEESNHDEFAQGVAVLALLVADSVLAVATACCEALVDFGRFILRPLPEATAAAFSCVPEQLLQRLKEPNARLRNAASAALHSLYEQEHLGRAFVMGVVCDGGGDRESWKLQMVRMDLCTSLTAEHSSLVRLHHEPILRLCVALLSAGNAKVRRRAVAFAAALYRVLGREVDAALCGVNPATLKLVNQERGVAATERSGADILREEDEDADVVSGDEVPAEAAVWDAALGTKSAACAFSAQWKVRERYVMRVHDTLRSVVCRPDEPHDLERGELYPALRALAERALSDSVGAVVTAALKLVHVALDLAPVSKLDGAETFDIVAPLVGPAVRHLQGHTEGTVRELLVAIATLTPTAPAVVVQHLVDLSPTKAAWKVLVPRLDAVASLLSTARAVEGAEELRTAAIATYAAEATLHANGNVRQAAVQLLACAGKTTSIDEQLAPLRTAVCDEVKAIIAGAVVPLRGSTAPNPKNKRQATTPLARPVTHDVSPPKATRKVGTGIRQRIAQHHQEQLMNGTLTASSGDVVKAKGQSWDVDVTEEAEEPGKAGKAGPPPAETDAGAADGAKLKPASVGTVRPGMLQRGQIVVA